MSTTSGYLYAAALLGCQPAEIINHGAVADLLTGGELQAYEFIRGHMMEHGKMPAVQTVQAHTGIELPDPLEPATYYLDVLKARAVERAVKNAMDAAAKLLQPGHKNPYQALQTLQDMVMEQMLREHADKVVDYRKAMDLLISTYVAKAIGEEGGGAYLGWPTLDEATGGIGIGDMLSFVGRPAAGKTWLLVSAAWHHWKQGGLPLLISMEMPALQVLQRLAAIDASVPIEHMKKGAFSTSSLTKFKVALEHAAEADRPFFVVDGNMTSTVEDVAMLASALKPSLILIDGGYLMKHPYERDRYRRVAENAELMKHMLLGQAPTVVSWQFSRDASKKGKGGKGKKIEDTTIDDIGYTDAIGQVSSIVAGMFQTESVETIHQRTVRLLKGRHGEQGQFAIRWNFAQMDFTEVQEQPLEELQFV